MLRFCDTFETVPGAAWCDWSPDSAKVLPMRFVVFLVLVSALAFAGAPQGNAQSGAAMPPMDGMQPIPPPEQLPVPIKLAGIGNSHITIKATPEAQQWFDQGLSLLHDFWDYESAKAFEEAIRKDPNCAMCFWGLAQAENFRGPMGKPYGKQTLDRAVKLEGKASKTDRLYIDAAEAESHEEGDHKASIAIYRKLVQKQPHDIQARIFLANALGNDDWAGYDDSGEPKGGQKEKIAILEAVLKDAPNDSAANHYWIHAMEPSNHPERAIPSSALLASLAPTSGHMVHMPGHIYYRVGDYASADRWFSASTEADERYMREQHVSVDDDWNYVHNLMYGIANLMEQGRLEAANVLSDHLAGARGQISESLYVWSARDQISRVSRRLPVALRIGDWSAILAMLDQAQLAPGEKTTNLRFLQSELRSFALGMQALEKGDLVAAQAASSQMDAGLWRQGADEQAADAAKDAEKAKADADKKSAAAGNGSAAQVPPLTTPVNPDAMSGPIVKTLSIASVELRGGVELLKGDTIQAKKLYDQAVLAEKKLGYHEPPFYIRPVAETEAEALLRAKDYAGAKAAFQRALEERPNSGFELYGIARADELAGNAALAQTEFQAFLKAWPSADQNLSQLAHARAALGQSDSLATAK
jgi:tetratricopeptide (TPR) repeat protein